MKGKHGNKSSGRSKFQQGIIIFMVLLVFCAATLVFTSIRGNLVVAGGDSSQGTRSENQVSSSPGVSSAGSSTVSPSSAPQSTVSQNKPSEISSAPASTPSSQMAESSQPSSSAVSAPSQGTPSTAESYQNLYPDLHTPKVPYKQENPNDKVVYLTFDDGPSSLTPALLDILDQYKVKATFFVVGNMGHYEQMKEIVNRGHVLAIHSYNHQYKQIYASPEAFLEDFKKMHDIILKETGVDAKIYRFPGGSINSFNKSTARAIIEEMNRRGYVYYDWNVSSGDAERNPTEASIYRDTMNGILSHNKSIVLMHNTRAKQKTLNQLPKIIEAAKAAGYRFDVLDPSVEPTQFSLKLLNK